MSFPENSNPDSYPDPNQNPNPNQSQEYPYAEAYTPGASSGAAPKKPPRRGLSISGVFSWIVVLGLTSLIFGTVFFIQAAQEQEVGGDATPMDLMQIQIQAKAHVGQESMNQNAPPVSPMLDTGPYEQRLCYTILLNETESSTSALAHLEELDKKAAKADLKLTENQKRLRSVVQELMESYDSGNSDSSLIPKEDREFLKERLGYVGEVALYPKDSPHTTERSNVNSQAKTLMIFGLLMLIGGFLVVSGGFVLALVLGVMFFTGKIRSKFQNHYTDHNIYIETFAIWMAVFFGSSLLLDLLSSQVDLPLMMLQPIIFFGSLTALCWPVIRGVPFSQVRKDIGWTFGNPIKELSSGVWVYLSTIPFLIPGFIALFVIVLILSGFAETPQEFARQAGPGHPIQEDIMTGDLVTVFCVFLATCVAAPVVEETMFRGVLYRHLRDVTSGWALGVSVVFSALLNAVIFASIHPQGVMAVPLLATLAVGFTIARQWRDSLMSSMAMHAIHNFGITCISVLIL